MFMCLIRINTIMDCDRVLVMHAGKVVEFDSPAALCQSENSIFHRLVGELGDQNAQNTRKRRNSET